MKKLFIPCFTLCLFISSVGKKTFAQGINNFYLMGYYSGMSGFGGTNIDFISGSPNIYYVNRPMNFNISNANISNSQGNILFYTNGIYIADATNDTMQNGGGLNPSFYTTQQYVQGLRIPQADLILPFPSDTNKFYLFHETIDLSSPFRPNKIYFSIIDLSLNGGLGSVILKNQIL
ncbi:MAG TPA: hypothetical protein VJY62_09330, partial [Bacteroidia bacterium]|nr:hypothetical protein [Bacteroidia bacterium]